ncbi:hypothetical protein ACSBR2_041992 [Camellia fascicularis]
MPHLRQDEVPPAGGKPGKGGVFVGHLLSGYSLPMEDLGQSKQTNVEGVGGTWREESKLPVRLQRQLFQGEFQKLAKKCHYRLFSGAGHQNWQTERLLLNFPENLNNMREKKKLPLEKPQSFLLIPPAVDHNKWGLATWRFLSLTVWKHITSQYLIFFAIAILVVSQATEAKKLKQTHIEFYMHDTVGGPNPSAVRVAGRSNFTGSNPIAAMFGSIYMMDNPLTVTHALNSIVMSRAQGIYVPVMEAHSVSLVRIQSQMRLGNAGRWRHGDVRASSRILLSQDIFNEPNGCNYRIQCYLVTLLKLEPLDFYIY